MPRSQLLNVKSNLPLGDTISTLLGHDQHRKLQIVVRGPPETVDAQASWQEQLGRGRAQLQQGNLVAQQTIRCKIIFPSQHNFLSVQHSLEALTLSQELPTPVATRRKQRGVLHHTKDGDVVLFSMQVNLSEWCMTIVQNHMEPL